MRPFNSHFAHHGAFTVPANWLPLLSMIRTNLSHISYRLTVVIISIQSKVSGDA